MHLVFTLIDLAPHVLLMDESRLKFAEVDFVATLGSANKHLELIYQWSLSQS